jgi:DNA-directed RNA polymerase sigma subunit (sigma70/sigma32)
LTRERIRQIEAGGLRKLQALLAARGIDASDLL